jgi:hypothetical protein
MEDRDPARLDPGQDRQRRLHVRARHCCRDDLHRGLVGFLLTFQLGSPYGHAASEVE